MFIQIAYILFLLLFTGFLLFDYWPENESITTAIKSPIGKTNDIMYMTITELIIIICVIIYNLGEIREVVLFLNFGILISLFKILFKIQVVSN